MDSGGRILTASFDFKTRYLDEISYIVNEVNPLVEAVPDTAVSAVVGPSERLVISTFWRQRNEGKRDRILTRALIASRESNHSYGANPF